MELWYSESVRDVQLVEAVEQRHPYLQRNYLTLERASHHTLGQPLEAVHLGFHQTASVVAAPLLPNFAP